jgi:S-methylmethionine-dependent homocysteine/selenocysteine methylase
VNRRAVDLLVELRPELEDHGLPFVISGCVGPRGDGYHPDHLLTPEESAGYHRDQIETFAGHRRRPRDGDHDDARGARRSGITRAAHDAGVPVVISFTVETDGRLPTGQSLGEAIDEVESATDRTPAYYMLNCAHPTHFAGALDSGSAWIARLCGIRANASRMSHDELDQAEDLDAGDPAELGAEYAELLAAHPDLRVLGGCCGTDDRHIASIASACITH